MNANTQTTKETIEQFTQKMGSAEYSYDYQGSNHNALKALTEVTLELGIRQAETTERLATAMETIADQQQNQSALLGLLVQLLMYNTNQHDDVVNFSKGSIPLKEVLAKLTHDNLNVQLRKDA